MKGVYLFLTCFSFNYDYLIKLFKKRSFVSFANSSISVRLNSDFIFQPIYNSHQNESEWLEMLYRPHNSSKELDIEAFFSELDREEKIDFDLFAISQLESLQNTHPNKRISVNISPLSLCSKKFISKVMFLSKNNKLNLSLICFEVVESDRLVNLCPDLIENINWMKRQGAWLALDDFGQGYAHWELLKLGLVNVIKTVNSNVAKTEITSDFLFGLYQFARSQGALAVLEGIENVSDYELGKSLGFQYFQGFFFN